MTRGERTDTSGWGRARLLSILAAGVAFAVMLAVGLGFAVHYALRSTDVRSTAAPAPSAAVAEETTATRSQPVLVDQSGGSEALGQAHRDQVAAVPMLRVAPHDSRRGTPAATPGPVMQIPAATGIGPAQVPTGFTHTPAGAVAQLAAIATTVLQGMSIPAVNQVHQQWSLPGAVNVQHWPLTKNVQTFLGTAGQGQSKEITVTVTATPVAGQVKGTDGPDWVLACVLLDVRAVITTAARVAYGYCERMQWVDDTNATSADGVPGGGRWMIASGPSPVPAPSTWPGTDLAAAAGWRTWVGPGQGAD